RAFWVNLTQGGRLQGGSTITQQFIKNSILTQEKTYIRKIKELILAYQIERKFTKDQILRMYLNEVPYGATAYGIEAAAQTYFGKSARDIDLTESALLVALTKAPTYYSPYGSHREELLARQRHILDLMEQAQFITPQEVQEAKKIDVLSKVISRREKIFAPHFVMYVKELLTQKYGERVVEEGGLKVYTTLDTSYQGAAEEVIRYFGEKNAENFKASNAALAAIDPRTGEILAMVGSRDWFNEEIDGMVNVTLRERQPGSSFKPVVYAASFLKGYTPETILYDVVTNFGLKAPGKGDYIPHDYDDKERGPVSIRKALAGSLNIPAVKTLYLTGLDNVLELAKNLGYTALKDKSHYGLSLVLGGGEVKLLEHTASFGVFAQEGIRHPISAIIRIEDRNGRVIEKLKIREEKVLEPE
ncbi:MAG: penicillin-binding protein, partial [Parcubacteria group bacterium CG_4_10_14_0_8_um_filter_35_7]